MDEDVYNLSLYPKHLRSIIEILIKFEERLSDGFEWYCDVPGMTALAQEVYDLKLSSKHEIASKQTSE